MAPGDTNTWHFTLVGTIIEGTAEEGYPAGEVVVMGNGRLMDEADGGIVDCLLGLSARDALETGESAPKAVALLT